MTRPVSATSSAATMAADGRRRVFTAPPGPAIRRRISLPWVLSGIVLSLTLALVGTVVADRVDTRLPVLATTHDLDAGDTIAAADVRVVRVAVDTGVATVSASQLSETLGHTVAVPLRAGSLLSPAVIGAIAWPPAGQAVIAVPVKPGRTPTGLTSGGHVAVLVTPAAGATTITSASGGAATVQARAVVVSVEPTADQSGTTVVSILLAAADGMRVAAAAGDVTVVLLGKGG